MTDHQGNATLLPKHLPSQRQSNPRVISAWLVNAFTYSLTEQFLVHPAYSKDNLHALTFPTKFRDIARLFLCSCLSRDEMLLSFFTIQQFSAQVIICFLNTFVFPPPSSCCLVISERPAFLHPFLALLIFHLDELKRSYLWITSLRAVLVIHLWQG